ncbi:biotin-dependent carboxyltransferase family protein [Blastococcus sp. LR1]|uniref:5-oxoprolinase subunit C family protein n=1 Tax=Blastococcus sp. LR1 TaxID=2877000 RepID=UPI001CC9470E|nr:biotin-dependent carboxyltransferase family protein [Blastococcus sp. LR1]MCA0144974.1 biotin-dependent carboxyltransferase family protein [Blastococcus sp. LR1]
MTLTVLAAGPLTTVQDTGRIGQAALGIGRSGACDRGSAALANRLVGNAADAAVLEVTYGGLAVRAEADLTVVTTGARCAGATAHNAPVRLRAGELLRLGAPVSGLRTYLGVRGGIDVPAVLGSRATDVLSGLGPPVVHDGDVLPVGAASLPLPDVDLAPVPDPPGGGVTVRVLPGPRADWFGDAGWARLVGQQWQVTSESNRVGLRLDGEPIDRVRTGELPSEGMVRGALQVPPSGLPVLFLADSPVTGGYPVIGYVRDDPRRSDVDRCAQLQPGQTVRFSV